MSRILATLSAIAILALFAASAEIDQPIKVIRSVCPEGADNVEAGRAWQELSRLPAADLPRLLVSFDGASPAAVNWLRAAVDAIAERESRAGHLLPTAELEAFLRDRKHSPRARRLAYELLCAGDPAVAKRLLPTMLDDPAAELRYDAVQSAFAATKSQPIESARAKTELQRLLQAARTGRQVEAIAQELGRRGEPVDLVSHLGFITRWQVAGVFDNTDGRGFRTTFPPESGVDVKAKYVGKHGEPVTWRPAASTDKSGSIDLSRLFPDPTGRSKGRKAAVAFAYTEVECPTDRPAEVRVASATAVRIVVNGQGVLARESYHQSFDRDMYVAPIRLRKGRNTILVKVCQNDQPEAWAQNWMFQLRLTDELGGAIRVRVIAPGEPE
jgi:hypothetical protein